MKACTIQSSANGILTYINSSTLQIIFNFRTSNEGVYLHISADPPWSTLIYFFSVFHLFGRFAVPSPHFKYFLMVFPTVHGARFISLISSTILQRIICFSDWSEITFQYYRKFEYLKSFKIRIFDWKFKKSVMYPIILHRVILNFDKKKNSTRVFNFPSTYNKKQLYEILLTKYQAKWRT